MVYLWLKEKHRLQPIATLCAAKTVVVKFIVSLSKNTTYIQSVIANLIVSEKLIKSIYAHVKVK